MSAEVIIYTTNYCPYCVRAKSLLTAKKASFREINVETREDLRRWLVSASGQRTVPQVFINGDSIGGFSELAELDREGKLDAMLLEEPSVRAPLPS